MKADTLTVEGDRLKAIIQAERGANPVFDAVLTILEQSPQHYKYVSTELEPASDLNWSSTAFTGKTFKRGDTTDGYPEFAKYITPNLAGAALVGVNNPRAGHWSGHEAMHLLQIEQGRPFNHTDELFRFYPLGGR